MPTERIFARGDLIGPYEVVRVLAAGGMSIVYEAAPQRGHRDDLLDLGISRVAVKVARMSLPETRRERRRLVARLDREFQTLFDLSKLGHPHVVRVFDWGWEEGTPWYAMELVDGATLEDALMQRPRLGQISYVFAQLCGAVGFLHNNGICHRDLKPSNVMLRADGGAPVLIDFGICLPPAQRTLTGAKDLLGTALYVSPEYAEHWLDPARKEPYVAAPTDDVWALGVMLYEILTGTLPWHTPPERRELLLREIQTSHPRHPCELYERVPRELGDLAMRLLDRDLQQRPSNAIEVLMLLGEAAEGTDVMSPIAPRRERPPEPTPSVAETESQEVVAAEEVAPTVQAEAATAPERRGAVVGGVAAALVLAWVAYVLAQISAPGSALLGVGGGMGALAMGGDAGRGWIRDEVGGFPASRAPEAVTAEGRALTSGVVFLAEGLPLPSRALPEQMQPPCRAGDKEMVGGCWREVMVLGVDGSPVNGCAPGLFAVPMEGRTRCFGMVLRPQPVLLRSLQDGGVR